MFILNLCSIIFFAFLYNYLYTEFDVQNNGKINFIDCFLLSATVQAGVGVSNIYPSKNLAKIAMIIQQIFMISIHVFTIYIFTI